MSIFGKIKSAIFGDKGPLGGQFSGHKDPTPEAPRQAPAAHPAPPGTGGPGFTPATKAPAPAAPPQPTPATSTTAPVDVEAVLAARAAASGEKLNWQSSIVDLMKLLGLDSSLAERKELATELGYTGAKDGSAEMNIWLHKAVMRKLAENGGKVPASMLD
jgi:hypothetical protein